MSSKDLDTPVTVLYALHDRTHKHLTRIMNYICEQSGKAYVSLSSFNVDEELYKAVPVELITHRGAIPFGRLEETWLLGVLNPFNDDLIADVEKHLQAPCHVYVVSPQEYEIFLARILEERPAAE
jgi:hypothetical protein